MKSPGHGEAGSLSPTGPRVTSRDGSVTLGQLIEQYMAAYQGRDTTRSTRVAYWQSKLGDVALRDLDDDLIADALDDLAKRPARFFAGKDAEGRPILKAKGKPLSGPTLNRFLASLSAVLTWAVKQRLTPKGWVSPARAVEKRPEHQGRLRFLDESERTRLLHACKAQRWPMMYALVLVAMTTGCRRGELERLRWRDVDLEVGMLHIHETKNGDPRLCPLTDAVVEELNCRRGKDDALVFASRKRPDVAMNFEAQWRKALRAAGIRGFTFHGLRHTSASVLVMAGATLHDVGQVLGHKTLSMSARYSHLSTAHKAKVVRNAMGSIK